MSNEELDAIALRNDLRGPVRRLTDIDTLIAEVKQLRAWQRKVVNEVEVAQMHTPPTDPSQDVFDEILKGAP